MTRFRRRTLAREIGEYAAVALKPRPLGFLVLTRWFRGLSNPKVNQSFVCTSLATSIGSQGPAAAMLLGAAHGRFETWGGGGGAGENLRASVHHGLKALEGCLCTGYFPLFESEQSSAT